MNLIAAILRAQLLSMRRGGLVVSVITGLIFYGFWTFLAFGVMLFFADPTNIPYLLLALSSGLLFATLYWQLAPVLSASFGASLDLRKLLAYPIPHNTLFVVEVLLRITACAEVPILFLGAAIGLMRNPQFGPATWPAIILGVVIFTATNILAAAGTRSLLERTFLHSRLKEVAMILLLSAGLVPQIVLFLGLRQRSFFRFVPTNVAWPWAAAARLILHRDFGLAGSITILYLAAAWAFGRWQFNRNIRYDAGSRKPRSRQTASSFRLPGWLLPDPIGALVEKELRSLARTARCRLVFAMSCLFGVVLYLPSLGRTGRPSFFQQNALTFMALYGLLMLGQITYWNAFGFDRENVQGYFSWPIRFRDALVAKNITVAFLMLPQLLVITAIALAFRLPVSPAKVLETIAVTFIAALYWCGIGNVVSVRIPRGMDPEKMNQMSGKLQALGIWSAPLFLLPIALAYWARFVFHNQWTFSATLLLAAILGAIFYYLGLDSAVTWADRHRESFIAQLSKSGGPFSTS